MDMFHLTGNVRDSLFPVSVVLQSPALCDAQRFSQPAANDASCPIRFIYRVIAATYHPAGSKHIISIFIVNRLLRYSIFGGNYVDNFGSLRKNVLAIVRLLSTF
jgi:hypothetical protein